MSERRVPTVGWKNGYGEGPDFAVHTIYDLIDVIRQKPGLFIGDPTLTGLMHFLHGFDAGLHSVGLPFEDASPPWRDFHGWIAERYGYPNSSLGWTNMLLEQMRSEQDAFYRFFEEIDEFRKVRGQ